MDSEMWIANLEIKLIGPWRPGD